MLIVVCAFVLLVTLVGCKPSSNEAGAATTASPTPVSSAPTSPATTPGCVAVEKKLAECGLTAKAAGLATPCDERVGACMAGQGCEAIRTKRTGCTFE